MPTWSGILSELGDLQQSGEKRAYDIVRRKYLALMHEHTGRELILYATKWTQAGPHVPPELVSISEEDLQALMEVIHGLEGSELDLIMHSPGGSPLAAEAFVTYLRSKFDHIRVFVPQLAMSAATMVACAADEVVMGKHSFLGPVDPQIILDTDLGSRSVPAQAILQQFEMARKECKDPAEMGAWLPMLSQYGPDLLVQCQNASEMSEELVLRWLTQYMFQNCEGAEQTAADLAEWLADHDYFKNHGRHISRDDLALRGMRIIELENDDQLQDLCLSAFHATTHTFDNTPAVKIVENHMGRAFIKQVRHMVVCDEPQHQQPEEQGED